MKDIQNLRDNRRINIRKVGVKTISYPVTVLDKARRLQRTVATVNMYVNLPHRFKGTHMSRFVEILNRFRGEINLESFHFILREMKERLNAEESHMEIEFPYFMQRETVPGTIDMERYECRMHGSLQDDDDLVMEISVPIFLPPFIHDLGGLPRSMGRWGTARVAVRFNCFVWLEDVIGLVEQGVEITSESPASVESVTRTLAEILSGHSAIAWFSIVVENLADGYTTFASIEGQGTRT